MHLVTERRWARTHLTVIVGCHAGGRAGVIDRRVGRPSAGAICRGGENEYVRGRKWNDEIKTFKKGNDIGT